MVGSKWDEKVGVGLRDSVHVSLDLRLEELKQARDSSGRWRGRLRCALLLSLVSGYITLMKPIE